jgi:hypothetical protein
MEIEEGPSHNIDDAPVRPADGVRCAAPTHPVRMAEKTQMCCTPLRSLYCKAGALSSVRPSTSVLVCCD